MMSRILRNFLALLPWPIYLTIIGFIVGRNGGAFFGLVVGIVYDVFAIMGADRVPIDAFEGRLLMVEEMPDLPDVIEAYSMKAGIPIPALYIVALDQPNILAWASSDGKSGFSRIGFPPQILDYVDKAEFNALIALAIARIASGESATLTRCGAVAGLALQAAYSPAINATFGVMKHDPDTRLTFVGAALLAILCPASRVALAASLPSNTLEWSDAYAARMIGSSSALISGLQKLTAAAPDLSTGALRAYNPGFSPLFLVSPYDKARNLPEGSSVPIKLASWIAEPLPSMEQRIDRLRSVDTAPQA